MKESDAVSDADMFRLNSTSFDGNYSPYQENCRLLFLDVSLSNFSMRSEGEPTASIRNLNQS